MADDGVEKPLSVPKFSSFKSKEPVVSSESKDVRSKTQEKDSRQGDHRSDRHRRPRHRDDESRRHRSRPRSRSREKTTGSEGNAKPLPSRRATSDLFAVDTKGDPLIRKYGGVDKSQIPSYYRHGAGRVLGTVGRLVIHNDGPRLQFSLRMPGEGSSLFREKDGLRSRRPRVHTISVRLRASKHIAPEDGPEDFIPLRKSKKRKRGDKDANSTEEDEQPSYRSIEGKAKPRQKFESDSDLTEDSDSSDDLDNANQDNPLKWKSVQLNRQLKDHPDDIDAWLELVEHQNTLLRAGEGINQEILENTAHSYTEIKVSMLTSALSNTSDPQDRKRVLVSLMREGVKVWTSKVAVAKWSEVLKDTTDNFALWKTHLDFSISNIATFQFDDVKNMLLDRLRHVLSRSKSEPSEDAYSEAIYIFLRATRFIHDAGFKELAVAAWQALLELTFFRPRNLSNPQLALESFQDFWESEVPRIGDAEAQGWRQYVETEGLGDLPESSNKDTSQVSTSRDMYKVWRNIEVHRAQQAKMPARTMDDGTEDDPFRVVMYSDLKGWVFIIPDEDVPTISQQLIDAFLLFSGLPPASRNTSWTEMALHDQFLMSPTIDVALQASWNVPVDGSEERHRAPPPFSRGGIGTRLSPSVLFPGSEWFQYMPPRAQNQVADLPWVQNTLKQLAFSGSFAPLAQYYMGLCLSTDSSTIKKQAKAILKRYPTDTDLYNAYALAEFAKGDSDTGDKVLASATGTPTLVAKSGGFLLFKTWSWAALQQGDMKMATRRLCCSTDETLRRSSPDDYSVTSTNVLKARQIISSEAHESLSTRNVKEASICAECLVLLAYLTAEGGTEPSSASQGNISAAMTALEEISREFRYFGHEKSAAHECILQFTARLLYLHASRGPFRRIYLREQLSRFIELFPQNTIFLSLFEWADSSLRVIDETRDMIHDKALAPAEDCLSSRVFAIHHELARGNANTTKAAFEHAFLSDSSKNSPVLWISYIRFCYSQKSFRAKVKDVFYRALRHCPWSKEVAMEAFVTLIHDMGSDELRSVYNTMTAKGLRIHVDLEEFVEERKGQKSRAQ